MYIYTTVHSLLRACAPYPAPPQPQGRRHQDAPAPPLSPLPHPGHRRRRGGRWDGPRSWSRRGKSGPRRGDRARGAAGAPLIGRERAPDPVGNWQQERLSQSRAGPGPIPGRALGGEGPGPGARGRGSAGLGPGAGPVRRRLRGGAPRLGVTAVGRAAGLRRGWPWSHCAAAWARGWSRSLLGRLPWEGEGRLTGRLQRICPHLPAGRGAARCARGGAGCRPAGSALICKGFVCADSPEKPAVPWWKGKRVS